jgi:hypothetical protein
VLAWNARARDKGRKHKHKQCQKVCDAKCMRGAVRATDTRSITYLVHPGSGACEGQPNYLAKAMTVKQIVRQRTWAEKEHCDNDGARWSTARATASPCCRHGNLEERVVESVPAQVTFAHNRKKKKKSGTRQRQ